METYVTSVEHESFHCPDFETEQVVEVTDGSTIVKETVVCCDPRQAMIPMADLVDVKDPDDVSLACRAWDGARETGAYTVDAMYHACF